MTRSEALDICIEALKEQEDGSDEYFDTLEDVEKLKKDTEISFITKKDCEFIGTALGDTMARLSHLLTLDLNYIAKVEAERALKSLDPVYAKFIKFDKNK